MNCPVYVFSVYHCISCSYRCGKVFSSFEPARVSQRLRLWRTTRPPCWRGRLALDSGVLFVLFYPGLMWSGHPVPTRHRWSQVRLLTHLVLNCSSPVSFQGLHHYHETLLDQLCFQSYQLLLSFE